MSIEAMKLALEAMNLARAAHGQMLLSDPPQEAWKAWGVASALTNAMKAVSQAIEQAEQSQPVAWVCEASTSDEKHAIDYWPGDIEDIPIGTKLYTAPPPRQPWVGLTTSDLDEIDAPIRERGSATIAEIYQAIEAKLKEKNT